MDLLSSLSRRRVLVTGARAFIGSHLCDRLVSEGAFVHGVSRRVVSHADASAVQWWQCDFLDLNSLRHLVQQVRPDVVFHLSGRVTAAPQVENVLPAFHSLLTSTVNLLTVLTDCGCARIVLAGSLTEPAPGAVDSPPSSPYAASKWAARAFGRMFHLLHRVPVVIARCYMTYGPRQHFSKVIPYTIMSLAHGRIPRLTSGTWAADWIYIDDLIEGMIRSAIATGVEGRTIELGSGQLTPIKDMIQRIVRLMRIRIQPDFGSLPDRPAEEIRVAEVDSTYGLLGWRPEVFLEEGLVATIRWYADRPDPGSDLATSAAE